MFNRIQHFYMRSKTREILITEIPDQDYHSHSKDQQARPMTSKNPRTATSRKESSLTADFNGIIQEENHQLDFDSSLGLEPDRETMPSKGDEYQSKLKYHLLTMANSSQGNKSKESARRKRNNRNKKSSINHLFQRIKTQIQQENQKKNEQPNEEKSMKRITKRRMCRLKTKQQFQEEYQEYITRKEKENVQELFRSVNREMKLSLKKSEGNIYFQNIRKDALKKIDYMYYNQKYYDDAEVKHLHSVVESCNALIHKKQCKNQTKPLYNIPKTQQQQLRMGQLHIKEPKNEQKKFLLNRTKAKPTQRSLLTDNKSVQKSLVSQLPNNHGGRYRHVQTETMRQTPFPKGFNQSQVKSFKNLQSSTSRALNDQLKIELNSKLDDIVTSCVSEKENMKEVKNGMKIFEFYCNRMTAGMQSKEKKLKNFLRLEDL